MLTASRRLMTRTPILIGMDSDPGLSSNDSSPLAWSVGVVLGERTRSPPRRR
jgi:hypothetical protein